MGCEAIDYAASALRGAAKVAVDTQPSCFETVAEDIVTANKTGSECGLDRRIKAISSLKRFHEGGVAEAVGDAHNNLVDHLCRAIKDRRTRPGAQAVCQIKSNMPKTDGSARMSSARWPSQRTVPAV